MTVMCETLHVSTAGYYAWRDRPVSAGQERRDRLIAEIRMIHDTMKARYGVAAKTARKFRHTTDSNHDLPVAANLLDRAFGPATANEAWVSDVTDIPTREGWLYLASATLGELDWPEVPANAGAVAV